MNVRVSENAERIIRSRLQSGEFSTESDVIDAALGLLDERADQPCAKKPISEEEFKHELLESGLMSSLPIPLDPTARRLFHPIKLDGEPVSETIIRERR